MIRKIAIGLAAVAILLVAATTVAVRMLFDAERVRATMAAQASARIGEPVDIGSASLTVWPRAGVTISDLAVGSPPRLTLARVEVSTALGALFSRRIEAADILVTGSELDLGVLLAVLDRLGTGEPDASAASPAGDPGESSPPLAVVSIRSLALEDVAITAEGRRAVFDARLSLDGDRLAIESASVRSDVTTLAATGEVESLSARRARLKMTADPLDLDGLMVFAQAFGGGAGATGADAPASPMDVSFDLSARAGSAAGIRFEDLTATGRLTERGLSLEPLRFGLFGGRLDGSVTVSTEGVEPVMAVNGTLAGVSMAQLTEFAGSPGAITGTMGGAFEVSGVGADPGGALSRTRGRGTMTIVDGEVPRLDLVRTIVLAFGKPDLAQPAGSGEAFSRIGADVTLASGVATISDLSFVSRDVEASGGGTLAFETGRLAVDLTAMLSRELTAQAGRDLVRFTADDGRVTVPAEVGGTVSSPSVSVDPSRLARRAIANEAQRQVESAIKGLLRRKRPPQ